MIGCLPAWVKQIRLAPKQILLLGLMATLRVLLHEVGGADHPRGQGVKSQVCAETVQSTKTTIKTRVDEGTK